MIKRFTSLDEVNNIMSEDIFKPQITVMGIGGAGTNSINNMIGMELSGVKFVVINTDSQSLEKSISPHKIQIGPKVTKGLGAGSKPEIGIQAAEESSAEIKTALEGTNMLFITAGMGGGTGTGASQVISKIAKEMNILTIAFVTKPFDFEGSQRRDIAINGIENLEKYIDSLVVVSNQNLLKSVTNKTSMVDAFKLADNVLLSGVKAVTDLITSNGLVNLDFNDIKSVIEGMGKTMIGSSEAEGEDRAKQVAEGAVYNHLLEDVQIGGAKKILINITGGDDLTLHEIDTVISTIKGELEEDAFIHFGTVWDGEMNGKIRVSIVATGLTVEDHSYKSDFTQKNHSAFSGKNFYYKNPASSSSTLSKARIVDKIDRDFPEDLQQDNFTESNKDNSSVNHNHYTRKKVGSTPSETNIQKIDPNNLESRRTNHIDSEESYDYEESLNAEDNSNKYTDNPKEHLIKSINKSHVVHTKTDTNLKDTTKDKVEVKAKIDRNQGEDEYEEDEIDDIKENAPPKKHINLFDLITKNRASKVSAREKVQEDNILNIKSRNFIDKSQNQTNEESFFDLPAFLKRK